MDQLSFLPLGGVAPPIIVGEPRARQSSVAAGIIRVGVAKEIPALLRDLGADPVRTVAEAGVDIRMLDDPDNIIPFAALGHLITVCIARTGCDHFGLLLGQRGGASSLGVVGLLLRQARDVGSALRDLVKFLHLHHRGAAANLSVDGDTAVLSYAIYYPGAESTDQIADGAMALGFNLMRGLCGPDWKPHEVLLPHRKPADVLPFRRFFQAPIRFEAETAALVFSTECLAKPLPGSDPDLHRLLQGHLHELDRADGGELPDQMRRILRSLLLHHQCSADGMAKLFAIHRRTLNRRLRSQGTGFHVLVEEARYQIARQLMSDTRVPLSQVAAALDYSEPSAFTRAFRRWSGMSPTEWRAAQTPLQPGPGP
jgi:AraC-like DNA-binding protein